MDPILEAVILFVISLIISAIIIYIITKIFGETEGFGPALLAAFIGTIIYTALYYVFGQIEGLVGFKWIASLIGGIGWLIALRFLYSIGWLKTFVLAIAIWIITWVIGIFLPESLKLIGPV